MTDEARPRALVVDDDMATRELVKAALARHTRKYDCTLAEDADEAAALADAQHFDVAIVDLIMPGKDGFWLIEHFASAHPHLPIAVLTGIQEVEEAYRALGLGARDYLMKPIEPEALRMAVDRAVEYAHLLRARAAFEDLSRQVLERMVALLVRVDGSSAETIEARAAVAREAEGAPSPPAARLERVLGLVDRLGELADD